MNRIDFVIPWVDGNDPMWQQEFIKYKSSAQGSQIDASTIRYRDWDNLQYIFRGIEAFAPWVGKVHFITWGHLPAWLNTNHPKLKIVNHKDYIPEKYLPVFSANPIELNLYRIDGLSEHFVYLNDDTFFIRPVKQERFFKQGLPRDIARLGIVKPNETIGTGAISVQSRRYDKNRAIVSNLGKWFNFRYSMGDMFKTLTLMPWKDLYGLKLNHMPLAYLKSVHEQLWNEEFEVLNQTCHNRFRTNHDMNQWLFRYEQLLSGRFAPHGCYDNLFIEICEQNLDRICEYISTAQGQMICMSDSQNIESFELCRDRIKIAFDKILPEKSDYEL